MSSPSNSAAAHPSVAASTRRGRAAPWLWGLVAIAAACAVFDSLVFVDETEDVLVERFGRIVATYDRPADRGLRFKWPRPIDAVRRFDRRVQLFDPPAREMFTSDRKNVTVDVYVCWKIAAAESLPETTATSARPLVRFYRGLGSVDVARSRLDSRIQSILNTEIGQVELASLLDVTDSEQGPDAAPGPLDALADRVRRQAIQRDREPQSLAESLGVEIVDVRIKRLNLPAGNLQAVYERMKSERRKIADRYRSAGLAENEVIRSQADRQADELLSRARADAERIRGEAEAESIAILNRAHAQDPEFHRMLQTLDAYGRILNERTTLVLSASSNLLKLLTEGVPKSDAPTSTPRVEIRPQPTPKSAEQDPLTPNPSPPQTGARGDNSNAVPAPVPSPETVP